MAVVDRERRVCPECGEAAQEQRFCSNCGKNLEAAALPTRADWEANRARAGEIPEGASTVEPIGAPRITEAPNRPLSKHRWWAAGAAALLATIVIVTVVATSGGGASASGDVGAPSGAQSAPVQSDASICAHRWDAEASQIDKQMAAAMIGAGEGSAHRQAAAGFSAGDPTSCLITVGDGVAFAQFSESNGVFSQGASGADIQLPGDWTWNASVDENGNVTAQ